MRGVLVGLLLVALRGTLVAQDLSSDESFSGVWYQVDVETGSAIKVRNWISISWSGSKYLVVYHDGDVESNGVFYLTKGKRTVEGILGQLGKVRFGKVRSSEQVENNGIVMDQINEVENIPLGNFQKREVLEKLLGKKLP